MEAREVIAQQISAAIQALDKARSTLASCEIDNHLDTAQFHISDIQFNVRSLRVMESLQMIN